MFSGEVKIPPSNHKTTNASVVAFWADSAPAHHPPRLPGHTALGPPEPVLHRHQDQVDRRRDPQAEDQDLPVAPLALGLEPDVPKHQEPSSLVSARKASSIVGRPSPELPSKPRPIARALTWSGVPSATRRPREITATRSATASASSSRWVANSRTRPWETQARALSQNARLASTSNEAVGSSRTRSSGLPATAMASRRRWRWPPDSRSVRRRATGPSSLTRRASSRESGSGYIPRIRSTSSATVAH